MPHRVVSLNWLPPVFYFMKVVLIYNHNDSNNNDTNHNDNNENENENENDLFMKTYHGRLPSLHYCDSKVLFSME